MTLPGAQPAGLIRMLLATVTPVSRPRSCNTGSLLLLAVVAPCSMTLKANRQSLMSTPPTLPPTTWLNATMEPRVLARRDDARKATEGHAGGRVLVGKCAVHDLEIPRRVVVRRTSGLEVDGRVVVPLGMKA